MAHKVCPGRVSGEIIRREAEKGLFILKEGKRGKECLGRRRENAESMAMSAFTERI